MTIRILIADDHPVVRDGLSAILSTQPDFEVVGEASDGAQLVALAESLQPDIVLTDLEMKGMDGVEAIRRLRAKPSNIGIIVLTVYNTDDVILAALQAGAQGYLLKGAPRAEIFNAIRVVQAGGSLLHPLVASRLITQARSPKTEPESLSEREMEVLRLISLGKVNKEIAVALNITERTVKFHVSAILSKLNVGNRTEAVTTAVQRGLISLPDLKDR